MNEVDKWLVRRAGGDEDDDQCGELEVKIVALVKVQITHIICRYQHVLVHCERAHGFKFCGVLYYYTLCMYIGVWSIRRYSYANSWDIQYIDKKVSARLMTSSHRDRKTISRYGPFFHHHGE